MKDTTKQRDARMMNAVAGLGGRSASFSEVDLRLGLVPSTGVPVRLPGWLDTLTGLVARRLAPISRLGAVKQQ